jgi:glycosyltransferase involved in cell wall biosynthesis
MRGVSDTICKCRINLFFKEGESMTRKRILFIHHGQGLGGAPTSLLLIIKNLDQTKYEPHVLFLHDGDAMALFRDEGVTVHGPVGWSDFSHTVVWWYRWYHVMHLLRAIIGYIAVSWRGVAQRYFNEIKPDIVHLNTSSLGAWAKVAHKMGIPVVWHIREPLAPGYLGMRRRMITRMVADYASVIVPISNNEGKPWKGDPRLQRVYNVVDTELFKANAELRRDWRYEAGMGNNDVGIVYVGGLSREKGALEAVRMFRKIHDDDSRTRLILAGYWPEYRFSLCRLLFGNGLYHRAVAREIKQLGDACIMVGPVRDIRPVLNASDILIFPATQGHFARPVLEAGAYELPVVASDLPPLDELVIQRITGYRCDVSDKRGWQKKLNKLIVERSHAQAMGRAGREFVGKHFSVGEQTKQLAEIYQGLDRDKNE